MYTRGLGFASREGVYLLEVSGSMAFGPTAATLVRNNTDLLWWWRSEDRGVGSPYTEFLLTAVERCGDREEDPPRIKEGGDFLTALQSFLVAEGLLEDFKSALHEHTSTLRADARKRMLYNRYLNRGERLYELGSLIQFWEDLAASLAATIQGPVLQ